MEPFTDLHPRNKEEEEDKKTRRKKHVFISINILNYRSKTENAFLFR